MAGNSNSGRPKKVVVEIPNTVIAHMRKTELFTADDYARMILLYNQGKTVPEIANEMGRTVPAITARLRKVKHKFAVMRHLPGWGGMVKLAYAMRTATMGCKWHPDCSTCPFPACTMDGYDPLWRTPKRPQNKRWSPGEIEHWNELTHLPEPLSDTVLANIFRTTVQDIVDYRERSETK